MKWLGLSLARRYPTRTNYAAVRSRSRSHEAVLTGREDWDQLYSEEVEAFAAQPKKIEEDWFVSLASVNEKRSRNSGMEIIRRLRQSMAPYLYPAFQRKVSKEESSDGSDAKVL